jgi:hypothetical protein
MIKNLSLNIHKRKKKYPKLIIINQINVRNYIKDVRNYKRKKKYPK